HDISRSWKPTGRGNCSARNTKHELHVRPHDGFHLSRPPSSLKTRALLGAGTLWRLLAGSRGNHIGNVALTASTLMPIDKASGAEQLSMLHESGCSIGLTTALPNSSSIVSMQSLLMSTTLSISNPVVPSGHPQFAPVLVGQSRSKIAFTAVRSGG